jgi:predicted nuclease of predicted toxin-antitoxin system
MRLVADENISWRLKKLLPHWQILPSNEIKSGERLTDIAIWQFAKSHNFTILTFDEDFSEIQNLNSYPPKIIWLRTGNLSTNEIAVLLINLESEINIFLTNNELGIYEIHS